MNAVTTVANANIALIKYWGKCNEELMLPTKNSFSVSVGALKSQTIIKFYETDLLFINGTQAKGQAFVKFEKFLVRFRKKFGIKDHFLVESFNNFPTAAGLASSSSSFASLALALNRICQLNLGKRELSILARLGSGSASRSIYDGFVLWNKGSVENESLSFAEQIFSTTHWPELRIIVAIVNSQMKKISSSEAMLTTVRTSQSYTGWVTRSELRLQPMIYAVSQRNISAVGTLAEAECLDMHETMRKSSPSINYLSDKTWKVINLIRNIRESGTNCYFTIDAGPNVKVVTTQSEQETVMQKLRSLSCIDQIIVSGV